MIVDMVNEICIQNYQLSNCDINELIPDKLKRITENGFETFSVISFNLSGIKNSVCFNGLEEFYELNMCKYIFTGTAQV